MRKDSDGEISFVPTKPNNPADAVDEMARLLTPGRLSQSARDLITTEYENILSLKRLDLSSQETRMVSLVADRWKEREQEKMHYTWCNGTKLFMPASNAVDGKVPASYNDQVACRSKSCTRTVYAESPW